MVGSVPITRQDLSTHNMPPNSDREAGVDISVNPRSNQFHDNPHSVKLDVKDKVGKDLSPDSVQICFAPGSKRCVELPETPPGPSGLRPLSPKPTVPYSDRRIGVRNAQQLESGRKTNSFGSLLDLVEKKEVQMRGVTLRTLYLCGYLFFGLVLGICLLVVSFQASSHATRVQEKATNETRDMLVATCEQGHTVLSVVGETALHQLMELGTHFLSAEIAFELRLFSSESVRAAEFLEYKWLHGEMDLTNLDTVRSLLWDTLLKFDHISKVNVATADGDQISVGRLADGNFEIEVTNTSSSHCLLCEAGALGSHKYHYVVTEPRQQTGAVPLGDSVHDVTKETWYDAGVEGDGELRWSPARMLSFDVGQSITIAMKNQDGLVVGVIAVDLCFATLSANLQRIRETFIAKTKHLSLRQELSAAMQGEGINMFILGSDGTLLGMAADLNHALKFGDGNLSSAHYTVVFNEEEVNSMDRAMPKALEYWEKYQHTEFSEHVTAGLEDVAHSNESQLFVVSPYLDKWGWKLEIVVEVPKSVFLNQYELALNSTQQEIDRSFEETEDSIKKSHAEVREVLVRSALIGVVVSIAVTLGLGVIGMLFFTSYISSKFREICEQMKRVANLDFSDTNSPHLANGSRSVQEVAQIGTSFHDMTVSLQSFARYVPSSVTDLLTKQRSVARLGVVPREVSIMFSDIVGFTSVAEALSPTELIEMLAEYLDEMSLCITESQGTVGKYMGDGIFAFWNSPNKVLNHAHQACSAALAQQRTLANLRNKWATKGLPQLQARMGLSVGDVLHGNIGSSSHMEWGMFGDEVNLTSRLESLCKKYGIFTMISHTMNERVKDVFLTRPIDRIVIGKKQHTDVFELICEKDAALEANESYCYQFENVVAAYRDRDFEGALASASTYLGKFPKDMVANIYVERCKAFITDPPPDDWKGEFICTEK